MEENRYSEKIILLLPDRELLRAEEARLRVDPRGDLPCPWLPPALAAAALTRRRSMSFASPGTPD